MSVQPPRAAPSRVSELRAWIESVGFPATVAAALLWALLVELPRIADRIEARIDRSNAALLDRLDATIAALSRR